MTLALPLDRAAIEAILPHREPFLLIDEVLELEPGERVVALKHVREDEWYLRGHFPGRPVMPGVLIVESMAQTSAALVVTTLGADAAGKVVYFMSIDGAKFRRPVMPGDQMRVEVSRKHRRGMVWKFQGIAKVNGVVVAEAVYSAMIMDRASNL